MDNIHAERGGRDYSHESCVLLNDAQGVGYRDRIKKLVAAATRAISTAVADTHLRDGLSALQPERPILPKRFSIWSWI
jgi:hypothetical protein